MATTIRLDKEIKKKFRDLLMNQFRDIRQYWSALLLMVDRDTMLTFRCQGSRVGQGAWDDYIPNTFATKKCKRMMIY